MSHNSFVLELKKLKLSDIYQFESAKCMHTFHHGKLPGTYNAFFQETSVFLSNHIC